MSIVTALARPEILTLKPYAHAVWRPSLIRLHANEVPWRPDADVTEAGLNRYPEPQPQALIARLADLYGVPTEYVLATRGADEAIDLLSRIFLRAGQDAILQATPAFGMYQVSARIQGAAVLDVPLDAAGGWSLDAAALLAAWRPNVKLVFLCSPNNPTGNALASGALEQVCVALADKAIVVIDEAYVEWSRAGSLTPWLARFANLAILRTLSKAHALAGARLGALLAAPELIDLARRVIPPYALAQPTIEIALKALSPESLRAAQLRRAALLDERAGLAAALRASPLVARVWDSDANFLLVDCHDAERFLASTLAAGLIVRDVRGYPGLSRSVRVSIGTGADNERLLHSLARTA